MYSRLGTLAAMAFSARWFFIQAIQSLPCVAWMQLTRLLVLKKYLIVKREKI